MAYLPTSTDYWHVLNDLKEEMISLKEALASFKPYVTKTRTKTSISPTAAQTVLLLAANDKRKAFTIYNNSTNTLYVGVDSDVSGGSQIAQLGTNAGVDSYIGFWGPAVWTGAIYVRRNSGSGAVVAYEFE